MSLRSEGIWVELGVIWGENSRKPVFGFRLSKEGLFCKGLRLGVFDLTVVQFHFYGIFSRYFSDTAKDTVNFRLLQLS